MYRNVTLVNEAERLRTGANTHYLTGLLHRYYNSGSTKYRHLYDLGRQDELETELQKFVAAKGVGRIMTKEEEDAVFKKMGWKR